MKARRTFWQRKTRCSLMGSPLVWLGAALVWGAAAACVTQDPNATGAISGRVTADQGEVRAFRVSAKDTVHGITYTGFTSQGQYQLYNLPPSTYAVQVVEETHESPEQSVELGPGQTVTVDVALMAKPAGSVAEAVAGGRARQGAELVHFDTLYPPSPARDILTERCFGCHSFRGFHRRGGRTEQQWRAAIERMFDAEAWNRQLGIVGPPLLEAQLPDRDKDVIARYLAELFPSDHQLRDLKLDPLVRDEEALAEAIYIQYELPPVEGPAFSDSRPSPGFHDAYPSRSTELQGLVWLSGTPNGTIWSVDVRDPRTTPSARARQYRIPHPDNINVRPHGIAEFNGFVYTSNLATGGITELGVSTGEFKTYDPVTPGSGGLTVEVDSKGNVWWTNNLGHSRVLRIDAVTKVVTEYDPVPGSQWYGITVDKQDRVWPTAYGAVTAAVPMYDPETEEWTLFPTTHTNRRPTVDSSGKVWTAQYFGNSIAEIDPATGEVTEHPLPLRYGNPYEVSADREDNIWIENETYNSLVKYDPRADTFTYFPFPIVGGHTPKINRDANGDPWFDLGGQLTTFRPRGNVPR